MATNHADRLLETKPKDNDNPADDESDSRTNNFRSSFALLLVEDNERAWFIPYMSLVATCAGQYRGTEFAFRFTDGDKLYEAVLRANAKNQDGFQKLISKLCSAALPILRPRGEAVVGVKVRPID